MTIIIENSHTNEELRFKSYSQHQPNNIDIIFICIILTFLLINLFFYGDWDLKPRSCIYYALFIPTS